jgi:uncharacterized membrane protein (TIGR02234 family)
LSATLAVLVGAGIVLVAESRNWATVRVSGVPGRAVVTADGRLAAPGTGALALVAAAGALAMAVAGRWARLLVAGLLVLAGLAVAGLAIAVLHSPGDAVEPAVATATGTVGRPLDGVATATGWPVLCVVGALLVAGGGAVGLIRGPTWPGPSRRYERAVGAGPAAPPGAAVPRSAASAGSPAPLASATSERDERLDAWDRLSSGDDPTDDRADRADPADPAAR